MQVHNLIQGTPEWHAHRRAHFNASDAAAMLGCSPHKTRTQLLNEIKAELAREHSQFVEERVFDPGHRFEALARPLAEEIIGDKLYPVTGSKGRLSASFDGITMLDDPSFEHKRLNVELRAIFDDMQTMAPEYRERSAARLLPKYHRVQMEQQLMVNEDGTRVLFMASEWKDDDTLIEERHCWYYSDLELRAEIEAGWAQFAIDLQTHEFVEPTAVVVPKAVTALPSVTVTVNGSITVTDNFKVFHVALLDFLEHRLIREPKTDQDFADLDQQIKAMKGAEAALEAAEGQMLAQIATIDGAKKTKDMLCKLTRDNRLMAEKLMTSEKERRRRELVAGGTVAFAAHLEALNARLGMPYMPKIAADFAAAIAGKKSIDSMKNGIATELARAKIAANEVADCIDTNLKMLRDVAGEHKFLFADTHAIVLKPCVDCRTLAESRIALHKDAERRREEQLREQVREEERKKLVAADAQRVADDLEAQRKAGEQSQLPQRFIMGGMPDADHPAVAAKVDPHPQPLTAGQQSILDAIPLAANVHPIAPPKPTSAPTMPSLRLGNISERLGFTVSQAFLRKLGFEPATLQGVAILYHEHEFTLICDALVAHIRMAQEDSRRAA